MGVKRRRKPAKGQDLGIGRQSEISAILRRHMNAVTWAEAFEKLIEAKGINSKPGRRWDSNSATVAIDKADALAKEVGVKPRTAGRRAFEMRQMQLKDLKERLEKFEEIPTIFLVPKPPNEF